MLLSLRIYLSLLPRVRLLNYKCFSPRPRPKGVTPEDRIFFSLVHICFKKKSDLLQGIFFLPDIGETNFCYLNSDGCDRGGAVRHQVKFSSKGKYGESGKQGHHL